MIAWKERQKETALCMSVVVLVDGVEFQRRLGVHIQTYTVVIKYFKLPKPTNIQIYKIIQFFSNMESF